MIPSLLSRACHRLAPACHGARAWAGLGCAASLLLVMVAGCAPKQGWHRDTSRTCERRQPAMVCVRAWPDRGVELEIGGVAVVPGECVVSPRRGGRVAVTWREPDGRRGHTRIRAPKGHRTELALGADGEVSVGAKLTCDRAMPPWTDTW